MLPRFLVLSEDGSHDAVPSLVALTRRMCQLVVPTLPVLEGICRASSGARDDRTLAAWKAAPTEIEEVERPWSRVSAGKDHNRALAERAYPAEVAFGAGKSFRDTVAALLENRQLVEALAELK